MKAVGVAVLLAALASGCGGVVQSTRPYANNDLQLVSAYAAREMCSCLFVQQMPLEYCRAWTKASPSVAQLSVDFEAKRVEAAALVQWAAAARWTGPRFGCVLER